MTHHQAVLAFNQLLVQRQFAAALEFYHSDITVTHNLEPAVFGIAEVRRRIIAFSETAHIDEMEVVSLLTEEGLSFTNWWLSYTDPAGVQWDKHNVFSFTSI